MKHKPLNLIKNLFNFAFLKSITSFQIKRLKSNPFTCLETAKNINHKAYGVLGVLIFLITLTFSYSKAFSQKLPDINQDIEVTIEELYYSDPYWGFSLNYPGNWILQNNPRKDFGFRINSPYLEVDPMGRPLSGSYLEIIVNEMNANEWENYKKDSFGYFTVNDFVGYKRTGYILDSYLTSDWTFYLHNRVHLFRYVTSSEVLLEDEFNLVIQIIESLNFSGEYSPIPEPKLDQPHLLDQFSLKHAFIFGPGKITKGYGPDWSHKGYDTYALDLCPNDNCVRNGIVLAPTGMKLIHSDHGYEMPESSRDYHIFQFHEDLQSKYCLSLAHFQITLPGFTPGKSVPQGAEIGRLIDYKYGVHLHMGIWSTPKETSCTDDPRYPLPFVNPFKLDGEEYEKDINHTGKTINSTNAPMCAQPYFLYKTNDAQASCSDPLPEPGKNDDAQFLTDVTLPDGTVVSPDQSLTKTWRMKNSGQSTWGSGYKLVFVNGERMGAPPSIDVPTTLPGHEVNLSVNITAPATPGLHVGYWQLRNPQNTFFGPKIWVKINVQSQNPGGDNITVFDISPASPSDAVKVHIVGRIKYFTDFRSMRFVIGNQNFEMPNLRQIGNQLEISLDWQTGSLPRGNYAILFEVANNADLNWSNPERRIANYTLIGTPQSQNRPPERPVLKNPYNWYLKDNAGNPASVELCVNQSHDPDGDTVFYWFEVKDQGGGVYATSGWTSNTCWTNTYNPNTYSWRVKTGDGIAESDWSAETWNFSVAKGGVYIGDITFYDENTNYTHICVPVEYDGIQGPQVNAWLNRAADGSENGEWRLLDHYGPNAEPDCTQPNVHGFWIRSPEYETGIHKLRVTAVKPDSGASQTKTATYTIAYIRPSDVNLLVPSNSRINGTWWNNRTIDFQWSPSLRVESYTLRASTNENVWADPNPLLNITVAGAVTSYSHTFDGDYAKIYWGLRAFNDVGYVDSPANVHFGIDRVKPSCQVLSLPPTTYESVFQVNWEGVDNSSGISAYDVQYKDMERGEWKEWIVNQPASKPYDLFTGQPGHSYHFRCRGRDQAGNVGNYPSTADTHIMVDLNTRPQTPWWDEAYSNRRDIIILNNMSEIDMPAKYPVMLRFDESTIPSAQEVYNASQSSNKCDDIRIVYSNNTELDRLIESCNVTRIDIRFATQTIIFAGSSDSTSYQLYYGNPSSNNPPVDARNIWPPQPDSNTVGLYYLSEGTGSTSQDYSNYGNHITSLGSMYWTSTDKFGNAIANSSFSSGPPGAYIPDAPSLGFTAFTFEAYLKRFDYPYGVIAFQTGRWGIRLTDRKLKVVVWPNPHDSDSQFISSQEYLQDENWHHIAVTFDGAQTVKFYRDGVLTDTGTLSQSGIRSGSSEICLGSACHEAERFYGIIDQVRISNTVRTSFPYAGIASVIDEPSVQVGSLITPPISGSPDLIVLSLNTYSDLGGGTLVEVEVKNQGNQSTHNGFFTDLYLDHIPQGPEGNPNSLQFWVNDPIEPGETIKLITRLTDLPGNLSNEGGLLSSFSESSGMLYTQADSTGALLEEDKDNNIYADGKFICVASPDAHENNDSKLAAKVIQVGESQLHNFHVPSDQDWMEFNAHAETTYRIYTSKLGPSSDTFLFIYGTDGTTILASNDDHGGSLASSLLWTAPADGMYYILVRHWNPYVGGCGTGYTITISEGGYKNYLPLINR